MANRYKKIEYSKLIGPSLSEYYDVLKKGAFYSIDGLALDLFNNKLKLAEEFYAYEIANRRTSQGLPTSVAHIGDGYSAIYHLLTDVSNSDVLLYRQEPYSAPLYVGSYGSSSSTPVMLISYKSLLLSFYTDGTKKQAWSDDEGATKTILSWDYQTPKSYFITDDNTLYIRTLNELLKSTDGKTWTLVYNANADDNFIHDADELDGEIYLIVSDEFKNTSLFCKLESDVPKVLRIFSGSGGNASKLRTFDNRIIITEYVDGLVILYEWDKGALNKIANYFVTLEYGINLPLADDDYLYIVLNGQTIIRLNTNNAIYTIDDYAPDQTDDRATTMLKWNGNICIGFSNIGVTSKFNFLMHRSDSEETRQSSGVLITPIFDKKNVPAYLVTKHKPLGDSARVVVKAKINHESTFATTLLTDFTNGSIGSEIALKDLISDDVNFIQFEITLDDSSDAGEVEDFELIYLHILNKIENAT